VIRPTEKAEFDEIVLILKARSAAQVPLKGVLTNAAQAALGEQIVESKRRMRYIEVLRQQGQSDIWLRPESFDPIRGALFISSTGDLDEAFWLVFLSVHFGKHRRGGWNLARDVYFRFGSESRWDWNSTAANPDAFHGWLSAHQGRLAQKDAIRHFGNHRKYESLKADSNRGTSKVFASYITWVGHNRGHSGLIADAQSATGGCPEALFDYLYHSMSAVTSFGRTAKFDFLTMIACHTLPVQPGRCGAHGCLSMETQSQNQRLRHWNPLSASWEAISASECRRWKIPCVTGKRVRTNLSRSEDDLPRISPLEIIQIIMLKAPRML
jgi:Alpha-glutamyl/putrescinyl thymine pyrophosphorylase clade 3